MILCKSCATTPYAKPRSLFNTLLLSMQVKVKDRSVVTTADAETRAVTPEGLQSRIKADVAATPSGVFIPCLVVWHCYRTPVEFSHAWQCGLMLRFLSIRAGTCSKGKAIP